MEGIGDGLGTDRDVLFNGLTGTFDKGYPTEPRFMSSEDLLKGNCGKHDFSFLFNINDL